MNKHVVCGVFGTIYYANILKDGMMSDRGRVDITDEAIRAVTQHMMETDDYDDSGNVTYTFPLKNGGKVCLATYDPRLFDLTPIKLETKDN